MSIDTTKPVRAVSLEEGDEIDLADDEYGDNDDAIFYFAVVNEVSEFRDADGYLWVKANTSQGEYDFPASHILKLKVVD